MTAVSTPVRDDAFLLMLRLAPGAIYSRPRFAAAYR